MGTWNTGIFDDDLAMDIKAEFEEAIEEGLSAKEATAMILEAYEDELEDEDEGPIIYLALAVLQMEKGIIEKSIKNKALYIIESGQGLDRWKEAGKDGYEKRLMVLNELKDKIIE
ncbi:MAG: hypothetical protein K0R15_2648 [Clostridiales bacterium]|nr:hypothetical protein [Clostridiales bacterium]